MCVNVEGVCWASCPLKGNKCSVAETQRCGGFGQFPGTQTQVTFRVTFSTGRGGGGGREEGGGREGRGNAAVSVEDRAVW